MPKRKATKNNNMGFLKNFGNNIKQGLANFDSNVLQPVLNAAKPIAAQIAETKFPGMGVGAAISSLPIGPDKTLVIKDNKTMTVLNEQGEPANLSDVDKQTLIKIGRETGVRPVKENTTEDSKGIKAMWKKYMQWWKDQPIIAGLATVAVVGVAGWGIYKGVKALMKGGRRGF